MSPEPNNSRDLASAAHMGEYQNVVRLLKGGASPDSRDVNGVSALYGALELGHRRVAKLLLEHGAEPFRKRSKKALSALHHAVRSEELVRTLLKLGLDPNDSDNAQRWTPLHLTRDAAVAKVLLGVGAQVDARDKKGLTPLDHALASDQKLVKLLLEHGSGFRDASRLLHRALQNAGDATGLLLLRHGYPVDVRNWYKKQTMLMVAVQFGASTCFAFLLKHNKTDVNGVDADGQTALFYAAEAGRRQMIQPLIAAGADPNLLDKSGKRAVDYATSREIKAALGKAAATTKRAQLPTKKAREPRASGKSASTKKTGAQRSPGKLAKRKRKRVD